MVIAERPGTSIEYLRGPLGLTQPGTTRLVNRLVQAGWVDRAGPGGRRGVQLTLTSAGRRILDEILVARQAAPIELLAPLSAAQRDQLAGLLEPLLGGRVHGRPDLERLCRLCERRACSGCPVARELDRIAG